VKRLLILLILGYRKFISPAFAPRCKYYPSCSTYAELSIREFGIRGVFMTLWRVIRCNPFSHGGVDYPSQSAIAVIRERQMS